MDEAKVRGGTTTSKRDWQRGARRPVQSHQLPVPKPVFDVGRRYVRFRELRADGFVEFAFAIGDPELSVELVMLLEDYKTFCRAQGVIYVTREQAATLDSEQSKWRYGQPGLEA